MSKVYTFEIVAKTGDIAEGDTQAITTIKPEVSINDSGKVTFIGENFQDSFLNFLFDKDTIFVADGLGSLKNISPDIIRATFSNPQYAVTNPSRWFDFNNASSGLSTSIEISSGIQINNNDQVLVRRLERVRGPGVINNVLFIAADGTPVGGLPGTFIDKPYTFIEKWDANTTNSVVPLAQGVGPIVVTSGSVLFPIPLGVFRGDYDIVSTFPSFNNDGDVVYLGRNVGSTGTKRYLATSLDREEYTGVSPYFWMADNDIFVRQFNNEITVLDLEINQLALIASAANGFTNIGENPRISDDGRIVTFYGELDNAGANTLNLTPGAGIFTAFKFGNSWRVQRVAGIASNGYLDPGEIFDDLDGDLIVDAGEDKGIFSRFEPDSPISTTSISRSIYTYYDERSGNALESLIAFIAYDDTNKRGLYTSRPQFKTDGTLFNSLVDPQLVVEESDSIGSLFNNLTVDKLTVYDSVNQKSQVAFHVESDATSHAVVTAVKPQMTINRWWATVGEEKISVDLTIVVPKEGTHFLKIAGENFITAAWDLTSDRTIEIFENGSSSSRTVSIEPDGEVLLGDLPIGEHKLRINHFQVPVTPIVEEVSFTLFGASNQKLTTLFVADRPEVPITNQYGIDINGTNQFVDVNQLIDHFAPILMFDSRERFSAPIDISSTWGQGRLMDGNSEDSLTLFSAYADLSKKFSEPAAIYATVAEDPTRGEIAIDYYFHYARSNWSEHSGFNTHEGDWEGVTLFLKNQGGQLIPDRMTFAQHNGASVLRTSFISNGTTVSWSNLDRTGDQAKVYVGLGGHASYPNAGETSLLTPFGFKVEEHRGTVSFNPSPTQVHYLPRAGSVNSPDWLLYSGRWGDPDLNGFGFLTPGDSAPRSPIFLDTIQAVTGNSEAGLRWLDPWDWSSEFTNDETDDSDGIPRAQENQAFNNGDGNQDGLVDGEQDNVASFPVSLPTGAGTTYLTLAVPLGTALRQVIPIPLSDFSAIPSGISAPFGLITFAITGIQQGGATTATLFLPQGTLVNTYWKYGSTPDNLTPRWYEFLFDAATGTGAKFQDVNGDGQNEIVLHFVDGQRGDSDLAANGQIQDPGAPAFSSVTTSPIASDDTVTIIEDSTVNIDVLANDIDTGGNSLTLSINTVPGFGTALVNDNGTPTDPTDDFITYTPTANFYGTDTFVYQVSDGIATATATVEVTVTPVDDAPTVASPIATVTVQEDAAETLLDISAVFTDVDNASTEISKTILTNSNAALVSATLTANQLLLDYQANQSGTADITLRGTANGQSVDTVFTVAVTPVNDAPIATQTLSNQTIAENQALNLTLPTGLFSDADPGDILTYSAQLADGNALPNWLTFNPATRQFTGTPSSSQTGSLNIKVTAQDAAGAVAESRFILTVTGASANVIAGTPNRDTLTGTPGNDLITGYAGADTLKGGQGRDQFIYTNFRDAGDIITDFEPGQDKLVFTQLLRSLSYNGANAIADGYVRLVQSGTGTNVQIDVDGAQGSGIFRPFLTIQNTSVSQVSPSNDLIF
jgi:hypothetical protein